MADTGKASQLVSNNKCVQDPVSVCELMPVCDNSKLSNNAEETNESASNIDPFTDLTFNLPSLDDDTSLQDLIDNELSLRISAQRSEILGRNDEAEDLQGNVDPDKKGENHYEGSKTSSGFVDGGIDILDINTQFIMAEGKHNFETMQGNGSHFFQTITDEDVDPDEVLQDMTSGHENLLDEISTPSFIFTQVDETDEPSTEDSNQYSDLMPVSTKSEDNISDNSDSDKLEFMAKANKTGSLDETSRAASTHEEKDKSQNDCSLLDTSDFNHGEYPKGTEKDILVSPDLELLPTDLENEFKVVDNITEYKDLNDELSVSLPDSQNLSTEENGTKLISISDKTNEDLIDEGERNSVQKNNIEIVISNDNTHETDIKNGKIIDFDASSSEIIVEDGNNVSSNILSQEQSANSDELDFIICNTNDGEIYNFVNGHSVTKLADFVENKSLSVDTVEIRHNTLDDVSLHDVASVEVCPDLSHSSASSVCSDSESKEFLSSSATEKKVVKKKKSDAGDSTKVKKSKKKKSECEKENISVIAQNFNAKDVELIHDNNLSELNSEEFFNDLSGVSVKELKQIYNKTSEEFDKAQTGIDREITIQNGMPYDLKSSFNKFDQINKKTVLHVRSVDASKVQQQFNQTAAGTPEQTTNCRACGKQVFQMEQIKAEKCVWHKNCFRCKECNKQLNVDTYDSHEGQLYCKPHFRDLFKPKAVLEEENELPRLRKPKMIICENEPIELPPDVVRASSKPDLGLEELSSLNVKSRFQVFEKGEEDPNAIERSLSTVSVKRSPSILSKLAKFQAKGMDIGVSDEALNGIPYEESSSSSEEEQEDDDGSEKPIIRFNKKQREQPMSFNKMDDIKCKWETGQAAKREEMRQERKQEIQNIRSRLFMGKQGKMKEMYEQAILDSEKGTQKKEVDIKSEKAKSIKERFERGETMPDDDEDDHNKEEMNKKAKEEEMSLFEAGISKKSRSLFLQLDANAKTQQQPLSPIKSPVHKEDVKKTREALFTQQVSKDIVKASDAVEDVKVETAEVSSKFKFFETYQEPKKEKKPFRITPPRDGQVKEKSPETEVYHDPNVVRCDDKLEEDEVKKSKTTSKMLSLFRQLEENANKEELPDGPKPLKCFTPPPDYTRDSEPSEEETESDEEEEEDEEETNPNYVRASDKIEDEFLKEARNAARAKVLRAKFERWEERENKLNASGSANNLNGLETEHSEQASIDSTKSIRAKFESMKSETDQPKEKQRPKVNRFV